ncbi:hypothetical protein HPB50_027035 [Hyalomma asiaticum]|uniref:Uncharacterized protein n=1 Tax=Hyalomma asiaticum TaxID=266040 RepID=A0ACB7RU27_HYAAI|nr:hypothetical protein HPB50_027035 [Hyalomma asiaticum]
MSREKSSSSRAEMMDFSITVKNNPPAFHPQDTPSSRKREQINDHAADRRGAFPLKRETYMMKHFWKYGVLSRLFGCLFIQHFRDRSLTRANVRIVSVYTLYSSAWILFSTSLSVVFIGRTFLLSDITRSFTKSLMFIVNSVVTVKIVLNFACMVLGSPRLLRFLRDAQAYERSASFVPLEDDRWRKLRVRVRKIVIAVALAVVYGLGMTIYVDSAMKDSRVHRGIPVLVSSFFTLFVFLFYDSLAYVIISCCSAVLAEYLRVELVALRSCGTPRLVEGVRLRLSLIKKLKRSLNNIWHPALAVWAACLILVLCITLYSIFDGDIGQPEVSLALAYSVYASMSFADIAILSQSLSDLAQQLRDAALHVETTGAGESYKEQMAGSIITYAVILVQTSDELAEHVDVSRLV